MLGKRPSFEQPSLQAASSESDLLPDVQVAPVSHVVEAKQVVFDQSPSDERPPRNTEEPDADDGNEPEPVQVPTAVQDAPAPQPVEYYIARALQSHPRLAAARLRVAAATQEIPQARALSDPTWNNTFWPIEDNALQTAGGRIAHQMMLQQQVPWPEKLRARAAIASREVGIARAELEQAEREITEAVRLAYYELWYATEAIAVVEDNRALVSDLVTLAETRYRTGGAQQDVLRAELEAERLEDELIRLRSQRTAAQADLGALLQRPLELAPEPVRELNLPENAGELDQLVDAALACSPELRELAWQIARDRERERLACLQRYPDFQLGVGWSAVTEDDALSGVANGNDNLSFMLGMTLPVWREKIDAGVREAAANRAATARTREAEEDAIYGRIRRLLAEAEGLFQQLELYRTRIIPRTERTLQLATADYRGERVDFFSLIDIYQELLVYQVQIARMEASLAGTLARLDRAVGCPLPTRNAVSE
ncbi:TolC family protein [Candidatus Laterigemmans baculatus]|uniref:TolC family protein n=1 Tax=Candidatus Laterigemmans baculatus TaxID=2770505 RepID=UPI001F3125E6|nr:TolC family protein [Candidatus Laterigemmans baculatus]